MIKVKSLKVKGFMSFKEEAIFNFGDNKVYLVTGVNGSGKSTLFTESFSFLFYGRPFRQMAVKNVVNDNSKACSVKIVYNNNKVLERIRGKEGDFTILSNDKQITQEDLSAIIGLERDLFFNSVIFGQGFGGFVYFKDKEKKKFITQLSLGFIDNYLERILTLKRSYELSIEELKRTIDRLRNDAKVKYIESIDLSKCYSEYEKNRAVSIKEQEKLYKSLEKSVNLTTLRISRTRKDIFRMEKDVARLDDKVKSISLNLAANESVKALNAQISKSLIAEKTILLDNLKVIKEMHSCPMCLQKIKNADSIIETINGKLSNVVIELRIRGNLKEQMDNEIIKWDEKISYLHSLQNKKIDVLESRRRYMEELISHKSKFTVERVFVKEKMEQLTQNYNPHKKQFDDIISQIANIKKDMLEEEGRLFIQLQYLSAMEFWDGEFRRFKNSIFSSMMESLGNIANKYLGFLSNNKFTMNISSSLRKTKSATRDKFRIDILHSGKVVDFDRLSGGERRQISLAVNAAFIQLLHRYIGGGFNFIVLDEVFENLDEYAKERVITMLEDMQRQTGKTLLLITHDNFIVEDKEGFNCIEIINKGGASYVQQKTS